MVTQFRFLSLRVLLVLAFFVAVIGISSCATTGGKAAFPPAPQLDFTFLNGSTGKISDYQGKNLLIVNFWGIRCANCIEEMPFLNRLHEKYSGRGLAILGVNTDGLDHTLLPKYMSQLPVKMSYPVVVDPEFKLVDSFEMMAAPLTIIIAADGTMRYRHEGYDQEIEGEYIELIEELLPQ